MAPGLLLASGSPRRRRALRSAGYCFMVESPDVDERRYPGEAPDAMVERLARTKSVAVARDLPGAQVVVGFDTTVVLDDEVLGKPRSVSEAIDMLGALAGRDHLVLTGWAMHGSGGTSSGVEASTVTMRGYDRLVVVAYVATGEPLDKAGSYAIQGFGRSLVAHWTGSFHNILGLPLERVSAELARCGVVPVTGL